MSEGSETERSERMKEAREATIGPHGVVWVRPGTTTPTIGPITPLDSPFAPWGCYGQGIIGPMVGLSGMKEWNGMSVA